MILISYLSKSIGGRERQASYIESYLKKKSIKYKTILTPRFTHAKYLQYILGAFRLFYNTLIFRPKSTYIMTPITPRNMTDTIFMTLPYIIYIFLTKPFGNKTVIRIAFTVEYDKYLTYVPQFILKRLTFHSITSIKQLNPKSSPEMITILNGVNKSIFFQNKKRITPKEFTYGYVGHFRKEKNIHLIVEAFNLLPQEIKDKSKLFLIGYDTSTKVGSQILEELMGLVNSFKINSKVHFLPLIPFENEDEIRAAYNMLNISILPSTYEGTANAVMESIACGTPTISFKYTQGIREVLKDCPSWYFGELTAASISTTLARAYEESSSSIRKECIDYVKGSLDLEDSVAKLVDYLQN